MKYLIILLFTFQAIAQESIFPLKYSLNDKGLFLQTPALYNLRMKKISSVSLSLKDSDDRFVVLKNDLLSHPLCNNIFTLEEIKSKNFDAGKGNCQNVYQNTYNHLIEEMQINDFFIMIFQSKNAKVYNCAIFQNKKFIGSIETDFKLENLKKFLHSIQNPKIKKFDTYIANANSYLEQAKWNSALKNYISAFILDPENKKIEELKKKFQLYQASLSKQKIVLKIFIK
ncbi:hypothetical protein [Sulfurimonas sp.]|uniref:hypothetical protein n=1 Tax=Sulfurimonas sp. TaxID=2022749 RepID=UPI003D0DFEEA